MDQLARAMQHSSLSKNKADWSFDKILRSFPMEICHMIAERLRPPPTTMPTVDSAISHRRLRDFIDFYEKKSTVPLELRDTFRRAYYKNATFRLQAATLNIRSIQETLTTFLGDIGDNINDITTLHLEQFDFEVLVDITRTNESISISGTLQSHWRTSEGDRELFEYVAGHMLAAANATADWGAKGNPLAEVTKHQLENVVKIFCKMEIARQMIATSWLFRNDDDGLDPSVLPDDRLLQEYVKWEEMRYQLKITGNQLDMESMDPWIFE